MSIRNVLQSLVLLFLAAASGGVPATAYYHDSADIRENTDWMARIPGDMPISRISIPGTHDSVAKNNGGDIVLTQSLSITQQLKAGIRFLDLRARHIENLFAMHHGAVYQDMMFGDVLDEMTSFLAAHPTETILVRLKEEHTPSGNTRTFEETFKWYLDIYASWFAHPGRPDPSLDEVRGKILLYSDFDRSDSSYGSYYRYFEKEDNYAFSTNWDLYWKWDLVKASLSRAHDDHAQGGHGLYITYLSGAGGSFPYFVASGKSSPQTYAPQLLTGRTTIGGWADSWPDFPRVACLGSWCSIVFMGTNQLTTDFLNGTSYNGVGVVVADFPGSHFIDAVIASTKWPDQTPVITYPRIPITRGRMFAAIDE